MLPTALIHFDTLILFKEKQLMHNCGYNNVACSTNKLYPIMF